jgi:hypothetical protein
LTHEAAPWAKRQMVFIGGLHRSGTTLLADLIASSDRVTALENTGQYKNEGQFLQDVYPLGRDLGGVTRWALDPRAHMTEAHAESVPDAATRLWNSWSPYWRDDARYVAEKSPPNLTKTRFLQAVFPNSRFVIITRHPLTQALAVRKWAPTWRERSGIRFSRLIEHWVRAHQLLREDEPLIRDLLVLRFEHLVCDPGTALRQLSDFLGIELDGDAATGVVDPSVLSAYRERWGRLSSPDRGQFFGQLDTGAPGGYRNVPRRLVERVALPREAVAIHQRFAAAVGAFGYDLQDLTNARPWRATADS